MVKNTKSQKHPQRLGTLSEFMVRFLYMTEDERRQNYGYDVGSYYKKIIDAINQSFQDVVMSYHHLPTKQREKIEINSGLRQIQNAALKYSIEKLPVQILDTTIKNLDDCLNIVKKQGNNRLYDIAMGDFEKVKKWLSAFQNYPKSTGLPL